jgi:hypothetical protein
MFQSTHPRWVRRTEVLKMLEERKFQSTHPRVVRLPPLCVPMNAEGNRHQSSNPQDGHLCLSPSPNSSNPTISQYPRHWEQRWRNPVALRRSRQSSQ